MKKLLLLFSLISFWASAQPQYNKGVIVEKILSTDTTSIGQKIQFPVDNNNVSIAKITIQPGQSTGWHKHNHPVFAYVLKGTLTVKFDNGKSLTFPPNTSFAESINALHNGFNNGQEDLVLIAVYLGEKK